MLDFRLHSAAGHAAGVLQSVGGMSRARNSLGKLGEGWSAVATPRTCSSEKSCASTSSFSSSVLKMPSTSQQNISHAVKGYLKLRLGSAPSGGGSTRYRTCGSVGPGRRLGR